MAGSVTWDAEPLGPPSDHELSALALAADPDVAVDDDAVCLWDLTGFGAIRLLPEWYMPSPMRGARVLRGWRRRLVLLIVVSLLVIDAYGLCSTYGQLRFG